MLLNTVDCRQLKALNATTALNKSWGMDLENMQMRCCSVIFALNNQRIRPRGELSEQSTCHTSPLSTRHLAMWPKIISLEILKIFALVLIGLIYVGVEVYSFFGLRGNYLRTVHHKNFRNVNYPHSKFAICAIAKDEDEFLVEWMEYHIKLGASRVYLFDNNSTRPQNLYIMDYIRSDFVEYFTVGDNKLPNSQLYVYERCLHEFGYRHDYMAFIDIDEFIVVKNKSLSIPDILDEYDDCGGLTLNWMLHGPSGHIQRPKGKIQDAYHKCFKHPLIKSIVNTQRVVGIQSNPHSFHYNFGYYACDTSHNRYL